MKRNLLAAVLAVSFTPLVNAGYYTGDLDGTYLPLAGSAETMEIGTTQPEQLGDVMIYFEREGWRQLPFLERLRVRRYLFVYGQIRGLVDTNTFLVDHVVTDLNQGGAIYTANDYLVLSQGDPYCSGGVPMKGIEYVNPVAGTGVFEALEFGQIQLTVTANNCIGTPDFGRNSMSVRPEGYIRFPTASGTE